MTVIAPSILIYYPIGTALLATLLLHQQHNLTIRRDLEQERFLLRTLIDQLPDYIFVKDAKLRFIASNTAHAHAVNITDISDMIGKSAPELFPEDMAENFESDDRRVLESGEALINAERITTDAAGNKRWVLTTKVPFRDPNGQIAGLVGISRDITARRRVEEALRNSEEQFRSAFDYAPIGMALVGLDGRWLKVNRAMSSLVGYSESELLHKTFQDITHPDDLDTDLNNVQQLLAGEAESYQMEKRYFHKLGHEVWVLLGVSLVRDSEDQPLHFISQIKDITQRKQTQAALTEERNLLRTLIDHMPDFVFIKDVKGRYLMTNKAVLAANGLMTSEQIIGKTNADLLPTELAQRYHDDDQKVIESGQLIVNKEEMSTDQAGLNHWLLTTKVPLRDQDGAITGLLGISRDITEHKKAEQQAVELVLQKEKMQVLADFIRDASHDLKTPLTVIQSSLYLLQRSPDPERKKQHATNIEQQVARLAQLIEDQLLMVRLDSTTEFVFESIDLNQIVREVMTNIHSHAEDQKVTIVEQLDKNNIPRIRGDEEKLMHALHNLVENAVNYTPEGGTVTIRTFASDSQAIFEVRDTGIGMAENDLQHIFERFYRADKARSTKTGGSGLGLPITQKVIEAHKGSIEVESVVGMGSTFRVCLPLSDSELPSPTTPNVTP